MLITSIRLSLALALSLAIASPASAYVPPPTTVLRDATKARDERQPGTVEARGQLQLGDAAPIPATLWVKAPGRCRLEIALPGASPAERPTAVVRGGKVASARALENAPAALALVDGACTLLAGARGEGGDRAWAQALAQRGVAVGTVALGHLGPRIAYVLGGTSRASSAAAQPQAWFEKPALHPIRIVGELAGARRDVRLLDWSAPPAAFPQVVEVHRGDAVEARFKVERVIPNPRVPDSMF